jgi:tetratricopeptide (TPR) repeat protein
VDQGYHQDRARDFRCRTVFPTGVVYHDRPYGFSHRDRYLHRFNDVYGYPCYQMIWPSFRFGVWYHHGLDWCLNFMYPFYHRKYVFVSLDGWWPTDYAYTRYYWYGWHPYEWYGYDPVAREVQSDTYNYYTYNYYGTDTADQPQTVYGIPGDELTPRPKDQTQEQEVSKPSEPTGTDVGFEEGVKAFEAEQYANAVECFRQVVAIDRQDRVAPFAYAQALFADGRYGDAAEALRQALARDPAQPSKGVFYPRGLYKDDDTLYEHIDRLMDQAEESPADADLQLLLGYHLLGIGEADQALSPLQKAEQEPTNAQAVGLLTDLARKITEKTATDKVEKPQTPGSKTADLDEDSL